MSGATPRPLADDPIRCRYEGCAGQHPIADDDDEHVTCPFCRQDLGLWPLAESVET